MAEAVSSPDPAGRMSRPIAPGALEPGRSLAWFAVSATALLMVAACAHYWWVQGLRSYLPDEGIYTFVGWSWLHGDWPYRDTWDHKGPVIFAVTLIRTALLGSAPEMTGVQEIVMGLATSSMLGVAAWRIWGIYPACMVGFSGILLWTQLGPTGGHVSTAGSIIALLNAACILSTVAAMRASGRKRSWLLLCLGAAGGLGFLAKPNAIGAFIAGGLLLFWIERRSGLRRIAVDAGLMAIGAIVPMILVAVIFGLAGALPQLIDVAYVYNARVRGPGILSEYSAFEMAKRVARGLLRLHVLLPVVIAMAMAALAVGENVRRPGDSRPFADAEMIAPLWLGMELLIYASNGVYGHHIFPILFSVSLCMGWMVSTALRLLPAQRQTWAILVAVPLLIWPAAEMARLRPSSSSELPDWRAVGERIKAETTPDQRILVFARMWGPSVLAVSERRTAVRYIHSPALYNTGYASDERWGEVVSVLSGSEAPPFVVIPRWRLDEPAEGGANTAWLVEEIDHAEANGPMADPTPYPARARTKDLLIERYDLDYCEGVLCVLALVRPAGQASPTGD